MARDEREVVVVERNGGGAIRWLLFGAALGAGLALIFAPKPGRELRRDLQRGIRRAKRLADETLEQFRREDGEDEEELHAAPEADSPAEPAVEPPEPKHSGGVLTAREELERRLAAARARRHAASGSEEEEPVA